MSVKFMSFVQELRESGIYFELSTYRHDAVSILVEVPGEHWEIDFLNDGTVDVERFVSNGEIRGEEALKDLFERFDERKYSDRVAKPGKSQIKKQKQVSSRLTSNHRTANKI